MQLHLTAAMLGYRIASDHPGDQVRLLLILTQDGRVPGQARRASVWSSSIGILLWK